MILPKSPINVEAHRVEPEKRGQEEEMHAGRCGINRAYRITLLNMESTTRFISLSY